jgi:hypothetical protein
MAAHGAATSFQEPEVLTPKGHSERGNRTSASKLKRSFWLEPAVARLLGIALYDQID